MTKVIAGLAAVLLLLCACSGRPGAELAGNWTAWYYPYGPGDDLNLDPAGTFSATGHPLGLDCRVPDRPSDDRATGRWRFDRDAMRIELDYDARTPRNCKLPPLLSLVVDPSEGETDLLVYPRGVDHLADRVRLIRPRRRPPPSAASFATNQVECFRASGKWVKWCSPGQYSCLTPYRDAGKACTDSSQCEGLCLADVATICTDDGGCIDAKIPEVGERFVGKCQRDDASCGSFIEIRKGRAEPRYDID